MVVHLLWWRKSQVRCSAVPVKKSPMCEKGGFQLQVVKFLEIVEFGEGLQQGIML